MVAADWLPASSVGYVLPVMVLMYKRHGTRFAPEIALLLTVIYASAAAHACELASIRWCPDRSLETAYQRDQQAALLAVLASVTPPVECFLGATGKTNRAAYFIAMYLATVIVCVHFGAGVMPALLLPILHAIVACYCFYCEWHTNTDPKPWTWFLCVAGAILGSTATCFLYVYARAKYEDDHDNTEYTGLHGAFHMISAASVACWYALLPDDAGMAARERKPYVRLPQLSRVEMSPL